MEIKRGSPLTALSSVQSVQRMCDYPQGAREGPQPGPCPDREDRPRWNLPSVGQVWALCSTKEAFKPPFQPLADGRAGASAWVHVRAVCLWAR